MMNGGRETGGKNSSGALAGRKGEGFGGRDSQTATAEAIGTDEDVRAAAREKEGEAEKMERRRRRRKLGGRESTRLSRELIGIERRWLAPQKSLSGVPQRQKVPARWNLSALQWFSIFFLLGVELRRLLELWGLCRLGASACAWLAAGDRPCGLSLFSESCFALRLLWFFYEKMLSLGYGRSGQLQLPTVRFVEAVACSENRPRGLPGNFGASYGVC